MTQLEPLKKTLLRHRSEHLLKFFEELTAEKREEYVRELLNLNFQEITKLYEKAMKSTNIELLDDLMRPLPSKNFVLEEKCSAEELEKYWLSGLEAISQGTVGVLLMAGGQGTRLGVTYPKGMYNIGLPSHKTLFQLQAERILKVQDLARKKYGNSGNIVWYIMTSESTDGQTKEFLKQHDYFGLNGSNIVIFEQGSFPCFDLNGKLILNAKDRFAIAPDGNGGVYKALKVNGILEDFRKRGIKYVHAHSVDNILVKVADPSFIGFCKDVGADCASKVVKKSYPLEPLGVTCLVEDKIQVVEYSEITPTTAKLKNDDGLVFNAGNICNHFFTVEFLEKVADKKMKLHIARKKIPFLNDAGELVHPEEPNGIKIEKFVFDVFEHSENFYAYEVHREMEFSPMKNCDLAGKDSPATAKRDLYKLHRQFLEANNAVIVGEEIEISPLVSYGGEGLERFCGKTFKAPCYISN